MKSQARGVVMKFELWSRGGRRSVFGTSSVLINGIKKSIESSEPSSERTRWRSSQHYSAAPRSEPDQDLQGTDWKGSVDNCEKTGVLSANGNVSLSPSWSMVEEFLWISRWMCFMAFLVWGALVIMLSIITPNRHAAVLMWPEQYRARKRGLLNQPPLYLYHLSNFFPTRMRSRHSFNHPTGETPEWLNTHFIELTIDTNRSQREFRDALFCY